MTDTPPAPKKLTLGIGTSIVFDMAEADAVFKKACADHGRIAGEAIYRAYMLERIDEPLAPGPGMEFVKAHLSMPHHELVICSRNSALTAVRAMKTLFKEGIIPNKLFFTNGGDISRYMKAYEVDLFLSTNDADIAAVMATGTPAAHIRHKDRPIDTNDLARAMAAAFGQSLATPPQPLVPEATQTKGPGKRSKSCFAKANAQPLAYVFDFDKVLAGPEADDYFAKKGLEAYRHYEKRNRDKPLDRGPHFSLYEKLCQINQQAGAGAEPYKVSIVTARGGLAAFRALTTLAHWGLEPNGELHYRDGHSKQPVLEVLRAHSPKGSIFFDDGEKNIKAAENAAMLAGHVPSKPKC